LADGILIEGLPQLRKIMNEVGSLRPVRRGLAKAAIHVRRHIATYPKQRPPVNPKWLYVRGRGMRYLPTGRTRLTSEDHANSWAGKSALTGLRWTIESDTSYGPYLQDEKKQTFYHKETGWKTMETVTEEQTAEANRMVRIEIDAALEGR
jgi:hypothetical protein